MDTLVSCSHWGMFRRPRRLMMMAKMTPEDEAKVREQWTRPGSFVEVRHPELVFVAMPDE